MRPTYDRPMYLTAKDVAAIRRKSEAALAQERKRGIGPPFLRDEGRILYPEDALYEWLEARRVDTTANTA